MKQKTFTFILAFVFIAFAVLPSALADVPRIVPYVNDFANVLSIDEETKLNVLCDSIEQNTTYEIAIVTVENTDGQDRVEFANEIGDENGVGKKDKDNGIVVLWSLDNEHGGAIATGRYSESIINDAKAGRIGRDARPLFDDGRYYDAFAQIVNNISSEINGTGEKSEIGDPISNPEDSSGIIFVIAIIVICIIILPVLYNAFNEEDSSGIGTAISASVGSSVLSSIGSSDSDNDGDSDSGGFSGGGFGGGSFGGGGAGF